MATGTDTHEHRPRQRGDLDVSTLIVAALASVVAALVTSKLWANGTLFSTALTPVIVALVKEYAQRPVRAIGSAAKAPIVAVREAAPITGSYAGERSTVPPEAERRGRVIEADRPDPDEYERLETVVPPGEEGATESPYRVYRKRSRAPRWWVVGLVTGLVAFIAAAAVITVPELVGGGSVGGTGRTTLFSHHTGTKKSSDAKTETTTDKTKSTPSDQRTTSTPDSSSADKSSSSSSGSSSSSSSSSSGATTTTPTTTTPTTTTPDATGGASPTTTTPQPQSVAPSTGSSSSGGG